MLVKNATLQWCWLALGIVLGASIWIGEVRADTASPVVTVIVRHAEKETGGGEDPLLTENGKQRALALANRVQALLPLLDANAKVAVFTTTAKRTRQTAEPLATQLGLTVTPIPATATLQAPNGLLAKLNASTASLRLVIGHSNTVPGIVKALSGKTVSAIPEQQFDNLYLVIRRGTTVRLMELRYGVRS